MVALPPRDHNLWIKNLPYVIIGSQEASDNRANMVVQIQGENFTKGEAKAIKKVALNINSFFMECEVKCLDYSNTGLITFYVDLVGGYPVDQPFALDQEYQDLDLGAELGQ